MDFTWKFTIFFGSAYGSLNIHWDEGPAHAKAREFPTYFFFPKGHIRVFLVHFISNISHTNCGHEHELTWCFGGLDLRLLC
jgi:hypothetical protein